MAEYNLTEIQNAARNKGMNLNAEQCHEFGQNYLKSGETIGEDLDTYARTYGSEICGMNR